VSVLFELFNFQITAAQFVLPLNLGVFPDQAVPDTFEPTGEAFCALIGFGVPAFLLFALKQGAFEALAFAGPPPRKITAQFPKKKLLVTEFPPSLFIKTLGECFKENIINDE
jgi:hypothetical protein